VTRLSEDSNMAWAFDRQETIPDVIRRYHEAQKADYAKPYLERIAELERQNADLQASNNTYLQRARDAEDALRRSGSGLAFLYEIRAALGWNDKTSLTIIPDGIRELLRERNEALDALAASRPTRPGSPSSEPQG